MASLSKQDMFTEIGTLHIFDDFQRDPNLTKFHQNLKGRSEFKELTRDGMSRLRVGDDDEEDWDDKGEVVEDDTPRRKRIKIHSNKENKEVEIDVQEFFKSVKNTAEELVITGNRAIGFENAIAKAKASGQTALYDQLKKS